METNLTFKDYVENLLILKAFNIEIADKYVRTKNELDYIMLKRSLKLTEKLQQNLDIDSLDDDMNALLQLYTLSEIYAISKAHEVRELEREK